jgi:hypothetical protein
MPPTSGPDPPPLLDWRHPDHWSWNAKPCRWCERPTHLRDSRRKPACKCCAEEALARQAAEAAEAHTLTTRRST